MSVAELILAVEDDAMGRQREKVGLGLRALGRLGWGLTRWSFVSLSMAGIVLASSWLLFASFDWLGAMPNAFASMLTMVLLPVMLAPMLAGMSYGRRRLRSFREDVPEVDEAFGLLDALGRSSEGVRGARSGELSIAEGDSTSGALSVSEFAEADARAHEELESVGRAEAHERGFFATLWRYTRNALLFGASYALPTLSMSTIAGFEVQHESTIMLMLVMFFCALLAMALYAGVSRDEPEGVRARHTVAGLFGGIFWIVGALGAFSNLSLFRAIGVLAVPPLAALLIWKAFAWSSMRQRATESPSRDSVVEEEGVAFDFAHEETERGEPARAPHTLSGR